MDEVEGSGARQPQTAGRPGVAGDARQTHDFLSPTLDGFRKAQRARRGPRRRAQALSDGITQLSGSMSFVVVHVLWFTLWIAANQLLSRPFDPYPYGLLTLIVSLEAIFLSTFVLISQNQESGKSDRRALQDFHTNLYSEVVVELISQHLGVDLADVEERYRRRVEEANTIESQPEAPQVRRRRGRGR